ncbi:MAG: hypothetical protein E7163_05255 [Firmicutes bacterium]|nr:hypothetical protein [Bacillota bacterium]
MDKKRAIIIAVILFLLIGLGSFVFAGSDNEPNSGNNNSENINQEENKGNQNDEEISSTEGEGGNESTTVSKVDNSYTKALEAVVKAEQNLTLEDIKNAKELIDKVTNGKDTKELVERIETVENLLEVTSLVEELASKTDNAKVLADLTTARKLRTPELIEAVKVLVDTITNETLKDEVTKLEEELTRLAVVLDDTTAPVIDGVKDKDVAQEVSAKLSEDDLIILLNDKEVEAEDLLSIKEEDTYTLKVSDKAFNETVITFTVDRTNPSISDVPEILTNKDVQPKVEEANLDNIKLTKNGEEVKDYNLTKLTEDGVYVLTANDLAGNTASATFEIDKTAPTAEVEYSTTDWTNGDVIATLVNASETITITNNNGSKKYIFTENGTFTFEFVDRAGNEGTATATVENIDKTPGVASIGGNTISDGDFTKPQTFDITITEENLEYVIYAWSNKGSASGKQNALKSGTKLLPSDMIDNGNGTYTFTVSTDFEGERMLYIRIVDKAGNVNEPQKGWYRIDGINPEISDLDNTDTFTVSDANLESVTINGEEQVLTGTSFSHTFIEDGYYTIIAVDRANTSVTKTLVVDNTPPEFINLDNGIFYLDDIQVNVEELHLDRIEVVVYADAYNTIEINNGDTLSKESIYKITAYDKYGNSNYISVAVDKTAPIFTDVENGHQYPQAVLNVEDLKVKSISVYNYGDGTTTEVANGTVLTENGKYAVIATDYAGRSTKVYVQVDKDAPTISGLDDGLYVNENETITITDDFLKTVTINGVEKTHDGHTYTEELTEGRYDIVAVDRAGNPTTATVIIDKTFPIFDGLSNGLYSTENLTINVTEENLAKIEAVVYEDNYATIELHNGDILDKESVYKLTATDLAGNSTIIHVAVDKTAPIFTDVENGHQYKEAVLNVKDVKLKSLSVYSYNDRTTIEVANGTVLTENGKYAVIAKDYVGKETKVYITIDEDAPEVIGVANNGLYTEVTITATDANAITAKIDGEVYTLGTLYNTVGEHELIVSDKAGNETKIKFSIGDYVTTNATELKNAIANATDNDVILVKDGTYDVGHLEIRKNITLKGESKSAVINVTGDGEAGMYIHSASVIENLKVVLTSGSGDAIKVSNISPSVKDIISTFKAKNIEVSGGNHGINIHGVANAKIDNATVTNSSKLSLAVSSSNVTLTNSNLAVGGWGRSAGIMHGSPEYHFGDTTVTIGAGNTLASVYAEGNQLANNDFVFSDGNNWTSTYYDALDTVVYEMQ